MWGNPSTDKYHVPLNNIFYRDNNIFYFVRSTYYTLIIYYLTDTKSKLINQIPRNHNPSFNNYARVNHPCPNTKLFNQ